MLPHHFSFLYEEDGKLPFRGLIWAKIVIQKVLLSDALPATALLRVLNPSHVTMKAKHSKCMSSESASSEASLIQKFHSL